MSIETPRPAPARDHNIVLIYEIGIVQQTKGLTKDLINEKLANPTRVLHWKSTTVNISIDIFSDKDSLEHRAGINSVIEVLDLLGCPRGFDYSSINLDAMMDIVDHMINKDIMSDHNWWNPQISFRYRKMTWEPLVDYKYVFNLIQSNSQARDKYYINSSHSSNSF